MRTKNAKAITRAEREHLGRANGWYERRFEPRATAVQTTCRQCNREMWLPASKVELYRTCGGDCLSAWNAARIAERTRSCETCGASFTPRPTQLAVGHGRYCSQKCNVTAHDALSAPGVRVRMVASRKANSEAWAWKFRGENNVRWSGGRKATYERRKAAGYIRDQNNRRRDYRRKKLPKGEITRLERLQRMRCANCRTCLRAGYHLDHIVPISKGGAHEAGNVQLLCPGCNRRKSALMPAEWAQLNGRLV